LRQAQVVSVLDRALAYRAAGDVSAHGSLLIPGEEFVRAREGTGLHKFSQNANAELASIDRRSQSYAPGFQFYKREGGAMLSKCANPSCSNQLIYLRQGKLFVMEHAPETAARLENPTSTKAKPVQRVEHFWLCGPCSADMTLTYDQQSGVRIIPKEQKFARAAAS